jgi:hypothetical protein
MKWVEQDMVNVPTWMSEDKTFTKELAKVISPRLYEKFLERFGINYIITVPQAKNLLLKDKVNGSTIMLVTAAIGTFWDNKTACQHLMNTTLWSNEALEKIKATFK